MTKHISCRHFDLRFPEGGATAERIKALNEVAGTVFRRASIERERLSPNRVRWIERLPPYDTPEFDALSSAPPLAPVPPAPDPAALLASLTLLLDHPDSLHTILLVAETRGVGAGKVAYELARKMAVAGIGA